MATQHPNSFGTLDGRARPSKSSLYCRRITPVGCFLAQQVKKGVLMINDWKELEKETIRIQKRFELELDGLHRQGVITAIDTQKYKNQVVVSKTALLEAARRQDLQKDIKEEYFISLIKDYQNSVQKIIDEAILRLGADVFLKYKFGQINEKALTYANEKSFSKSQLQLLESFMDGATAYALRILPKRTSAWSSPKIDFQKMVNDYAEILQDYAETIQTNKYQPVSLITRRQNG